MITMTRRLQTFAALLGCLLWLLPAAGARAADGCGDLVDVGSSALPIMLDLDTTGAADDATSLCVSEVGAPDLVQAVSLTATRILEILATPAPGYDVLLYLRAFDCEDPLAELACAAAAGAGGQERLFLTLPPGTYYVFVDGNAPAESGPVNLSVSTASPVEGTSWGRIKQAFAAR